jgi:amino acid transporter
MSNDPATQTPAPAEEPPPRLVPEPSTLAPEPGPPIAEPAPLPLRVWRFLVGAPRNLADRSIFHRLALIPFLAWVGLGADGLSSSAYGPEEAFRSLGEHRYLAVVLAAVMATTILVISAAYSRIIEAFPHGGGGYVVASKLLGERIGLTSGAALVVDYVLTITVSIAAAGDALFSFVPLHFHVWKLPLEVFFIAGLTTLNIRGIRESVMTLTPVFLIFLVTHAALILAGVGRHAAALPATAAGLGAGFHHGYATLGTAGLLLLLVHAYSLGGGTYTGIEAVSNGIPIMREPRVQTAKRTMIYMASSLAVTASGLLLCYLLWNVAHAEGKTLNAVLTELVFGDLPFGRALVVLTLFSEGALLVVAAQAGFVDGPRVLSNMAIDSWVPRRFAALSDRLTTQNGLLLMGAASLAALLYTRGDVRHIVVMYSINVFLTFSLSMLSMTRATWRRRRGRPWKRRMTLFGAGFLLCATILVITIREKFLEGGWITLAVTGSLVVLCFVIRRHYRRVTALIAKLYAELNNLPPEPSGPVPDLDRQKPTAAVLVAAYGGLGIHTTLNIFRAFPGYFHNVVFVSVGVVDSGAFKGEEALAELRARTEEALQRYVGLARRLGVAATYRMAIGTDAVEEAEKLCHAVLEEFPRTTFVAGKVIFERERWYQRVLHNETAYAIQKRLQWAGYSMVILPARVQ